MSVKLAKALLKSKKVKKPKKKNIKINRTRYK